MLEEQQPDHGVRVAAGQVVLERGEGRLDREEGPERDRSGDHGPPRVADDEGRHQQLVVGLARGWRYQSRNTVATGCAASWGPGRVSVTTVRPWVRAQSATAAVNLGLGAPLGLRRLVVGGRGVRPVEVVLRVSPPCAPGWNTCRSPTRTTGQLDRSSTMITGASGSSADSRNSAYAVGQRAATWSGSRSSGTPSARPGPGRACGAAPRRGCGPAGPGACRSPNRRASIGRFGSPTRATGTSTVPGSHGAPIAAARWARAPLLEPTRTAGIAPARVLVGQPAGHRSRGRRPPAGRGRRPRRRPPGCRSAGAAARAGGRRRGPAGPGAPDWPRCGKGLPRRARAERGQQGRGRVEQRDRVGRLRGHSTAYAHQVVDQAEEALRILGRPRVRAARRDPQGAAEPAASAAAYAYVVSWS